VIQQEVVQAQTQNLLSEAPLARVLVQIRWPELTDFRLEDVAASIARQLGGDYPLKRRDAELQVVFTPAGPQQQTNGFVHRFASAMEDWTVSVGESFLAVETSNYRGHEDLLSRLRTALTALAESAKVPVINRIGYRYTNRIVGIDDLSSLRERFSSSVLGGFGDVPEGYELAHSITESVYRVGSSFLLVRSAQVGANESIDPTLEPVPEKSWILDLDAYDETRVGFDTDTVSSIATRLSSMASKHFHTLTTEEFVKRYA
jgi:uncharacterized protein (TIGR04255 family)